jgi:integrase
MQLGKRVELEPRSIAKLPPQEIVYEIADARVVGLRVVVQASGFKSWAVRYVRPDGRTCKLTLGPFPRINLKQARKLASAALLEVHTGKDPAAEKIEARRRAKTDSVQAAYDQYEKAHFSKLKASTSKEAKRLFKTRILPKWRNRPIVSITKRDVLALLDAIIAEGAPTTANRVFSALSGFFNWAIRRDIIAVSPCFGVVKPTPEKSRERVLTDLEIKWFWKACDEIAFPFGSLFKILLLTGARRSEVAGMTRDELDQVAHLWSLPGERTKNGKPHAIFIADEFDGLLDKVKTNYEFIFGYDKPPSGFSKAKKALDKAIAKLATEDFEQAPAPWRLHDLRRTMRTGLARLGIVTEVAERCINHISGPSFGGVAGTYNRFGYPVEMEVAFKAWSAHVAKIVGSSQSLANKT